MLPKKLSVTLNHSLLRVGGGLAIAVAIAFSGEQLGAQITPDDTLGEESSVVNPRDATSDKIDGGAIRGQNLFHSFQKFNVDSGRGVYFSNPEAVSNIFSRVTGNNVSNILGTLGVDGAANLFLINPNGIIFGEGAALDLQGSFAATTADGIEFGERGDFSADTPKSPGLLTVNPSAYLFNQATSGRIVNNSVAANPTSGFAVGLSVPIGKNLSLVGGDIALNSGLISAPGARVDLGGLSASGKIGISNNGSLSFTNNVERADIFIINSLVSISLAEGGTISINARNLEIVNSSLLAGSSQNLANSEAQAANIILSATEKIKIEGNFPGLLATAIINNGGNISLDAVSDITITGSSQIVSNTGGKGNAGNIDITSNLLSIVDASTISTSTFNEGNAGNITIKVSDLFSASNGSVIASNVGQADGTPAAGKVGNISITAKDVALTEGSQLQAGFYSNSRGESGVVFIKADNSIFFDGSNSGIFTNVESGAIADGSNIILQANSISFTNGSGSTASNSGQGDTGNILIKASDNFLAANDILIVSNVGQVDGLPAAGKVGNITIEAKDVALTNRSQVQAGSFANSQGESGSVSILATDSIAINDRSGIFTNVEPNAIANGGDIQLEANSISFTNTSGLSASNSGQGNAGNIKITADSFTLNNNSAILASNTPSANTSTVFPGGNIDLQISDSLILRNNSDISTEASIDADGGNINITADSIIAFNDSDIFAFAADGQGGNINLNTPAYFAENFTLNSLTDNPNNLDNNARADLNATGAISGSVTTPDVSFLQNSLSELLENAIDTETLIANSCVVPSGRQRGTFIITGAGGLPVRPGDASISPYPTGTVRTVPSAHSPQPGATRPWQKGDPIVEPTGTYQLADGKLVLSRECS